LHSYPDVDVQFYEVEWEELTRSQRYKAKRFIEENCIEFLGNNTWFCHPIKGYNKTCYTISCEENDWKCNCQFNALKGGLCSHILSVWLWLKDFQVTS